MDRIFMAGKITETVLKAMCPFRTGNLMTAGISTFDGGARILIGGEAAPYAIFTEENWDELGGKLAGKKNPNEGWIERAIKTALPLIEKAISGDMTEAEAALIMKKYNGITKKRFELYGKYEREAAARLEKKIKAATEKTKQ